MKFILLLVFLLISCSRGEYWENRFPPAPVAGVIEISNTVSVCKANAIGCYDRMTGQIWIQSALEQNLRLCVLRHEYRHAAGDDHPRFNEPGYGIDCGDGKIMPGMA